MVRLTRNLLRVSLLGAVTQLTPVSLGQSLYDRPVSPPTRDENGVLDLDTVSVGFSVYAVSKGAIRPPEPKRYQVNDLVTVIISHTSDASREGEASTEKDWELGGNITSLPDLIKLLQLRYENYDNLPQTIDATLSKEFEGEGEETATTSLTTRVTARVEEVLPNGTLLLASRTYVAINEEEEVITISGWCNPQDISVSNTLQSSRMYDLRVSLQHSGQVRNATKKGIIPRVFDAIFNF